MCRLCGRWIKDEKMSESTIFSKLKTTAYMLLAALTLNLAQAYMRWQAIGVGGSVSRQIPALISFFKYAVIMVVSILFLVHQKSASRGIIKKKIPALVTIGLSDSIASIMLFVAGMFVPLALNSIIGDMHIILTPLILFAFGMMKLDYRYLIVFFCAFLGISCFIGTDSGRINDAFNVYLLIPFGSALLWSLAGISARSLNEVPKSAVQLSIAVSGIVFSGCFLLFNGWNFDYTVLGSSNMLFALVLSVMSQFFFITSLTGGELLSALIAAPAYALFGGIVGRMFFDERLGYFEISGILIIVACIIYFHYLQKERSHG